VFFSSEDWRIRNATLLPSGETRGEEGSRCSMMSAKFSGLSFEAAELLKISQKGITPMFHLQMRSDVVGCIDFILVSMWSDPVERSLENPRNATRTLFTSQVSQAGFAGSAAG
jgi:hypothetical protein